MLLLTFGLLVVNFVISWANAAYVGRYWTESKEIGGAFRGEIIAGYVMSVAGFTMVYGYIVVLIMPAILPLFKFSAEQIATFEELTANLVYLLVVGPIILSGFYIWLRSLRRAWEERTFSSIVTAGWNTYAQLHNMASLRRAAPSAFKTVTGILFGNSKKSRSRRSSSSSSSSSNAVVVYLALIVIAVVLLGGYFTADAIMRHADAEYDFFGQVKEQRLSK